MIVKLNDVKNIDLSIFSNFEGLTPDEFFFNNAPGRQHYKLLAYLSTLFNDVDIFDIGTHMGSSALALSYNPNNRVYTFDLLDKIKPGPNSIKSRPNVTFSQDNLMEEAGREEWEERLLKSPLIFFDIDPHDGFLEYEFYKYLIQKNYQGLLICDDIYYFKGMRDKFWYLIPSEHKYSITHFGHWSGTGVVCLNKDHPITFEGVSKIPNNWTLVTAYFDLTKMEDASTEIVKRPASHYLSQSNATLGTDANMIIFCEEENKDTILKYRPKHLHDKTLIITQSFEDFPLTKYRQHIIENRKSHPYQFDNRNTASYYLFCMARYAMLKQSIETNPFNSTHFAWINICIERMGYSNLVHLEEAFSLNRDKFSTCYIDYIPHFLINNTNEYFNRGRCSMCSGFFTGRADYMKQFCDLIEEKFLYYLKLGYGHADEQLYSPVYFDHPEIFDWYLGDYFQMITNYAHVYERPDAPINNLIRNSFNNKDYKVCYEACTKLWDSVIKGKVQLDSNSLSTFMNCFNECKKNI